MNCDIEECYVMESDPELWNAWGIILARDRDTCNWELTMRQRLSLRRN